MEQHPDLLITGHFIDIDAGTALHWLYKNRIGDQTGLFVTEKAFQIHIASAGRNIHFL